MGRILEIAPFDGDREHATRLAVERGVAVHDAPCLRLARRRDAERVTLDGFLARAASAGRPGWPGPPSPRGLPQAPPRV